MFETMDQDSIIHLSTMCIGRFFMNSHNFMKKREEALYHSQKSHLDASHLLYFTVFGVSAEAIRALDMAELAIHSYFHKDTRNN